MSTDVGTPKATGNPYVGPQSFRRGDALYGRDRETADLLDLLIAERVVLLYSPSGAGKSSLIAAGLVRQLEAEGFEVLPTIRLTHEPPPGSSFTGPARNRYALSTLLSLEEGLPPEHQHRTADLDAMTVTEYLANWPDLDHKPGNEVLLFDQFEEVITADPNDHAMKEEFFADIGVALRDRNLWALFAIREDFLAELDPYSRFVPTRFANRYRLDLLGVDQALDAMILPAADSGADFKRPAAEQLVDDLRRIRVQRAAGVSEELGPTVEPVQLQVACRQVWNRLGAGGTAIDVEDVEALGNVNQALASYYADCVAAAATESGVGERALRDWFETELVTPQGIRGQVLYGPRQNGAFSEQAVKMLTAAHLVRAESRRGATWYELAHDRLIEPVKNDNAQWRERNLSVFERHAAWWDEQQRPDQALLSGADLVNAEQWVAANAATLSPREHEFLDASRKVADQAARDRRATKRIRQWLAVAVVGFLLAAGLGSWGWLAERRAANLANQAEISALAGQAYFALNSDVDLALLLAQRAVSSPGGATGDLYPAQVLQVAVDQSPVVDVLGGHGTATGAIYSDDGALIATHHDNGPIVVWDAATGDDLYRLRPDADGLNDPSSLTFSPDRTRIAAITSDGRIAVWSIESDSAPTLIDAHADTTSWRIAFSPDGTRIASAGFGTGLSVVDLTGQPDPGFDPTESAEVSGNDLGWTPDGTQIVVAGVDGVVSFWDGDTGRHIRDDEVHSSGAVALDVSPAGSTVASASDGLSVVTDIATGEIIHRLKWFGTVDVSFSSDGSRYVLADQFGTATVVDPSRADPLRHVTANGMSLVSADVSPTNVGRVLVATNEGAPAVWDVSAGYPGVESHIEPLPDGHVLTAAYDGGVHVWPPDGPPRQLVPPSTDQIQGAAVNQAGDRVAVAHSSGAVEVWSIAEASRQLDLSIGSSGAWAVAFSPDDRFVAAGNGDGTVVVWDASTGEQAHYLQGHDDLVTALEYGADSSQLVSASRDKTAIIWDIEQEEPKFAPRLGSRATAVAWNSRGDVVAAAAEDGSVQFWDPNSGQQLDDGGGAHARSVNDIAFDSTGDRLVSASDDKSIIVWDVATKSVDKQIRRTFEPFGAAFSSDGQRVLVGDGRLGPHVVYLNWEELLRVAEQKATRELSDGECRQFLRDDPECREG